MKIKHLLLLILIGGLLYLDYLWYIVSDRHLIIVWKVINFVISFLSLFAIIERLYEYIKNNRFPKIRRFLNFKLF